MPTCKQCGKKYGLSFFASLNGDNWMKCPECQKENRDIRREAGLQEEGRLIARQNWQDKKAEIARKEKWKRDFLKRSPFG